MRSLVLFSMFLLLASCSQTRESKVMPQKVFQYSFQAPARTLVGSGLSKQLAAGKTNTPIKIKLANKKIATAKLGRKYFSASGHECRKYMDTINQKYSACNIGGRWYQTSPIIIYK